MFKNHIIIICVTIHAVFCGQQLDEDVFEIYIGSTDHANKFKNGDDVTLICIYQPIKGAKDVRVSAHKCTGKQCSKFYEFSMVTHFKRFRATNGIDNITDESYPGIIYLTIPKANANTVGKYQCKMQYKEPNSDQMKHLQTEYDHLRIKNRGKNHLAQ